MKATTDQVNHYNEFGRLYGDAIITAEHPDTWTSDTNPDSQMNQQMRSRIAEQERVVLKYFNKPDVILDLGCGFGRQTYMMAKNNFKTIGIDNSDIFIDIAKDLFKKHNLEPNFICDSVLTYNDGKRYKQITLFDVVEHFNAGEKKDFVMHLAENICDAGAKVIITVPYMSETSLKDRLTNANKWLTSHFDSLSAKKEHPYPLPYKSTLANLFAPYFNLKEYFHKGDNAFFVFERL